MKCAIYNALTHAVEDALRDFPLLPSATDWSFGEIGSVLASLSVASVGELSLNCVTVIEYTEILRQIPPAVKLANVNSLFIMAHGALYFQEIRRRHSPKEAMKIAAQRLLSLHDR